MEKSARLQFSPGFRKMLIVFAVGLALIGGKRVSESFGQPQIYEKDFASGYLLAKALRAGVDPYLPLPELAQRFGLPTKMANLNHPTPHTLAMGWLCYPFSWLPYEQAAVAWLLFELVCLLVAVRWLLQCLDVAVTPRRWLAGSALALAWIPVVDDLYLGQFSLLLLVLWLGVWKSLRATRDAQSGVLLGVMLTFKLVGWPIVLWLAWQRRWRGVLAAGIVTALLHGIASALHGWATMQNYYSNIGPQLSALYRTHDANYSLWTFGARLFAPFGLNFVTLPPWHAPMLVKLFTVMVPLAAVAVALWWASRIQQPDVAFALLVCLSLLVNPIAWAHYLVANCIVIGLILRRLQQLDWPRVWTQRFMLIVWPLSMTQTSWALLTLVGNGFGKAADGRPLVPFALAWVTVLPTLAVLALGWLLWRVHTLGEPAQAERVAQWERTVAAEWSPTI